MSSEAPAPAAGPVAVARWVEDVAARQPAMTAGDATVEVVDLADYELPLLDEPVPAIFGEYHNAHTKRWAATVGSFDGFVFVTPEYNHSVPAALKNAIDFLYAEWNDKVAGFVGYGVEGGTRAVEHLRSVLAEMKVAGVRTQVGLAVFDAFEFADPTDPTSPGVCSPGQRQESKLTTMLDEVITWSGAFESLRDRTAQAVRT